MPLLSEIRNKLIENIEKLKQFNKTAAELLKNSRESYINQVTLSAQQIKSWNSRFGSSFITEIDSTQKQWGLTCQALAKISNEFEIKEQSRNELTHEQRRKLNNVLTNFDLEIIKLTTLFETAANYIQQKPKVMEPRNSQLIEKTDAVMKTLEEIRPIHQMHSPYSIFKLS